jgi:dynein heavy chain
MDCNGWYDRKSVGKFMEIVDIVFIAAMGPPGNCFLIMWQEEEGM